jgi:Xaa-Pro aminopeptidase
MERDAQARRHRPKIGAGQPAPGWLLDHGDLNLHALGPGDDLLAEWAMAGVALPNRRAIRRYRIERVRAQLRDGECDGALLYDPINIRYATDTTNMSLFTMHNQVRYAFVAADGPVVLFEPSWSEFLATHSEVVDEIRPSRSFIYFYVGSRMEEIACRWADELVELIVEHGRGGRQLAVDSVDIAGLRALEARGVNVVSGMPLMEKARMVKCGDEIVTMRAAIDACQRNICGGGTPSATQAATYALAREQIERNIQLHVPGASFREISDRAWYPSVEAHNRYTSLSHGVGLCAEYPTLYVREEWDEHGHDGVLEPGMVMSVEAFVGPKDASEGVKLEQQILITDTGQELLTDYPIDLEQAV